MTTHQSRVEHALETWLPSETTQPIQLHKAMRYAVFNGGKRIRPLLVYATGSALKLPKAPLDAIACAIECIHSYSLIHDDLPAMDDDDMRRNQPSCHKAFDEATAILAGDSLQSLAFHILANNKAGINPPEIRLKMIDQLAIASGSRGMAGGQALEMEYSNQTLNLAEIENLHIHKTGALIRASVMLAVLLQANIETQTIESLDHYAKCIGLSFQIQDDILDYTDNNGTVIDNKNASVNTNYLSIINITDAKQRLNDLHQEALQSLTILGENSRILHQLSKYIIERHY